MSFDTRWFVVLAKLYIPSTLNNDLLLWLGVQKKKADSAQIHKSMSFIWIVWSTLDVYLWSIHEFLPNSMIFFQFQSVVKWSLVNKNSRFQLIFAQWGKIISEGALIISCPFIFTLLFLLRLENCILQLEILWNC